MGYASFAHSGKELVTAEQIGSGQIELRHLSPGLYAELRTINTHNHSGSKSMKIELRNLTGAFGKRGFYIWSSDATKRYQVTINSGTGDWVLTEA